MAEQQKTQQEVELDTDGVNEESVSVDQPKEPDPAFQKKEDVDLGYTDVAQETKTEEEKPEAKEEPKEEDKEVVEEKVEEKPVETKPDSLKDRQSNYQKRINELVFQAK